nr:hypothetical protein CFP56_60702 [Quercus suber]
MDFMSTSVCSRSPDHGSSLQRSKASGCHVSHAPMPSWQRRAQMWSCWWAVVIGPLSIASRGARIPSSDRDQGDQDETVLYAVWATRKPGQKRVARSWSAASSLLTLHERPYWGVKMQ